MPILRYFVVVGSTLLALLFVTDYYFPATKGVALAHSSGIDKAIIRIHSAQKWPEKLEFGTSQPTNFALSTANSPSPTISPPDNNMTAEIETPALSTTMEEGDKRVVGRRNVNEVAPTPSKFAGLKTKRQFTRRRIATGKIERSKRFATSSPQVPTWNFFAANNF